MMAEPERIPCPVCGEMIMPAARVCRFCGEQLGDGSLSSDVEGDATGGIIPYKNPPALIAYYCGVFSIIPCFPIGIVAFVLGIKGLRNAKRHPQVRGQVHAWIGIIVGGLFGLIWTGVTLTGIIWAVANQ
jgi:hypothetical protein